MVTRQQRKASAAPSRVLHWRNVSEDVTEDELCSLVLVFGIVTRLIMLRGSCQALMEMRDVASAADVVAHYATRAISIRGRSLWVQFSSHTKLQGAPRKSASGATSRRQNRQTRRGASGTGPVVSISASEPPPPTPSRLGASADAVSPRMSLAPAQTSPETAHAAQLARRAGTDAQGGAKEHGSTGATHSDPTTTTTAASSTSTSTAATAHSSPDSASRVILIQLCELGEGPGHELMSVNIGAEDVRQICAPFGTVDKAIIFGHKDGQRQALVEMGSLEDARRAHDALQNKTLLRRADDSAVCFIIGSLRTSFSRRTHLTIKYESATSCDFSHAAPLDPHSTLFMLTAGPTASAPAPAATSDLRVSRPVLRSCASEPQLATSPGVDRSPHGSTGRVRDPFAATMPAKFGAGASLADILADPLGDAALFGGQAKAGQAKAGQAKAGQAKAGQAASEIPSWRRASSEHSLRDSVRDNTVLAPQSSLRASAGGRGEGALARGASLPSLGDAHKKETTHVVRVTHVSMLADHEILFNLFSTVGNICRILHRPGFALVEYEGHEQAVQAVTCLNKVSLMSSEMRVSLSAHQTITDASAADYEASPLNRFRFHRSKNAKHITAPTPVLHVSNLAYGVELDDLLAFFGDATVAGRIFQVRSRRQGLIQFEDVPQAVDALATKHDALLAGRHLRCSFSLKCVDP